MKGSAVLHYDIVDISKYSFWVSCEGMLNVVKTRISKLFEDMDESQRMGTGR